MTLRELLNTISNETVITIYRAANYDEYDDVLLAHNTVYALAMTENKNYLNSLDKKVWWQRIKTCYDKDGEYTTLEILLK